MKGELTVTKDFLKSEIEEVFREKGTRLDYKMGTMIELPRAALVAGTIAKNVDFLSFGTNDLTQTTYGISRDDAGKFMGEYTLRGIFSKDPFASIDREGVGFLVEWANREGKRSQPRHSCGHLWGARRGSRVHCLLPRDRTRLRQLFALPGSGGAIGGGSSCVVVKSLSEQARDLMKGQRFDSLAYALLDFERQKFESFNIGDHSHSNVYFDLASLTKPLTLAALYHRKADLFSSQDHLLLNHRGGLPAWGNLPCHGWREELLGQKVVSSETLYSDYSALRLMLELEQKSGKSLREMCDFYWDGELCHWRDLPPTATCPATGLSRR